jgi:hypothetical protein
MTGNEGSREHNNTQLDRRTYLNHSDSNTWLRGGELAYLEPVKITASDSSSRSWELEGGILHVQKEGRVRHESRYILP